MRRLFFILVALAACLLFSEQGGGVRAGERVRSAAFSAGDVRFDQWQCERDCNSDLNQLRVLRAAETCPLVPSFRNAGQGWAARGVLRSAAVHGTGTAKLTPAFQSVDLSAGMHPVDYYVYRLRRLII